MQNEQLFARKRWDARSRASCAISRHECTRVLDGAREAIVTTDAAFAIRFLNAAAEGALGGTREQLVGRSLREVLPGDYGGVVPQVGGEWRFQPLSSGWAVYGEGAPAARAGEPSTQQMIQAQQLAAVGQLAASVAHEVGAPLTAISVAVEYLLREDAPRDEDTRRDLEMILAQTRRIARLARHLVDLARPGAAVFAALDLNQVVSDGFALIEKQLRRSEVEAVLRLDPKVHPMRGDGYQLQQVLINLLLNAQRAVQGREAGARRVEVRTRRLEDANELVVSDTGTGITEEDLPKVFLPFFSRAGSTGLGLALARSIVHQHHGSIEVESRPGVGATFTVRLPLVADADAR